MEMIWEKFNQSSCKLYLSTDMVEKDIFVGQATKLRD